MTQKRKANNNCSPTADLPSPQVEPTADVAETSEVTTAQKFQTSLDRVRQRANGGDQRAREALIRYMDANPSRWVELGNMAAHAQMSLIDEITQGEWLTGEAIKRETARLRERLSRPNQSPLEELAVTRLVACWVQVQFVESRCRLAHGELERGKFWLQRQQQIHRIYSQAEKSLLLIRSLLPVEASPDCSSANALNDIPGTNGHANSAGTNGKLKEPPEAKAADDTFMASVGGVNRIASRLNGHGGGLNKYLARAGGG